MNWNFVGMRATFYTLSILAIGLCISMIAWKGLNLGIEFRSGSVLRVSFEEKVTRDDYYMLNYTSGTTGNPKGVKVHHWGILTASLQSLPAFDMTEDDCYISYLPAPHVFENYVFVAAIIAGTKVGFYSGDPAGLVDDCAELKPTFFPSVPRLFNKIYHRVKGELAQLSGCRKWLAEKGLAIKLAAFRADASYTSCCYDNLVFSNV